MVISAKGIVLKEVQVGDGDKILTALLEGVGKVSISAKGAKRVNSRLLPLAQLFSYAEFELYQGKKMYSLNGGEPLMSFLELRQDVVKFALATYMAELVLYVTNEQNPDDEILRLILNGLYALCKFQKPVAFLKAAFELRLLCACGFQPELFCCRECGEVVEEVAFDFDSSSALCERCYSRRGGEGSVILQPALLKLLRYLITCDPKKLYSVSAEGETLKGLSGFCEDFLIRQLGTVPKTLNFYKGLL